MAKTRKSIPASGKAAEFATAVTGLGVAPTASAVFECAVAHGFNHNFLARRDEKLAVVHVFKDGSQAEFNLGELNHEDRTVRLVAERTTKRNTRKPLTGVSYQRNESERQGMAEEYKRWLCKSRGWFTDRQQCHKCCGAKTVLPRLDDMTYSRARTWKKNRVAAGKPPYMTEDDRQECAHCKGEGTLPLHASVPDIKRADQYIAEQNARLDEIADAAVEAIKAHLYARGLRRTLYWSRPASVEEYDRLEAEHEALSEELERENELERLAREVENARFHTLSAEEQLEYMNDWNRVPGYRAHEERANEIRHQMHRWHPQYGFFYKPGDGRTIWVGTRGPARYHGCPKADIKLVIEPGTIAPTKADLDAMVEDALAELFADALIAA